MSGGNSLPQVPLVTSQKPIVLDTAPEEQCEQTLRVDGPAQPKETKELQIKTIQLIKPCVWFLSCFFKIILRCF